MKLTEARELLAMISAYDNRCRFGERAPQDWYEFLAGVPYEDARQSVIAHYRLVDPDPILPGDVLRRARQLARHRAPRRELPPAPVRSERGAMAREAIREITGGAVERFRAEHPEHRPYQHRRPRPTRVA